MIRVTAAIAAFDESRLRFASSTYARVILLIAMVLVSCPRLLQAQTLTISNQNSSLTLTRANPGFSSATGTAGNPAQLSEKLEWTVDGRRILVYPPLPAGFIDVGHWHFGGHVAANQIHAQGPQLGYATSAVDGTVTAGTVYTVDGSSPGSGVSRISEKTDLHNKSNTSVTIHLTGMGFKPTRAGAEIPDLTGLNVTGTTVVFSQGDTVASSLTDGPPFAPVTVLRAFSFSGFNPLFSETVSLGAGGTLTMITELRVERSPLVLQVILWIVLVAVFAGAGAMMIRRRRSQGK